MESTGRTDDGEAGESTGLPASAGVNGVDDHDDDGDDGDDDHGDHGDCGHDGHEYGHHGGHVVDGRRDVRDELAAIRGRAEAVRDEQVDRALARLEANGELPPERRATVERLADRLVVRLLAVPAATLDAAEDGEDVDADAALDLFRK